MVQGNGGARASRRIQLLQQELDRHMRLLPRDAVGCDRQIIEWLKRFAELDQPGLAYDRKSIAESLKGAGYKMGEEWKTSPRIRGKNRATGKSCGRSSARSSRIWSVIPTGR